MTKRKREVRWTPALLLLILSALSGLLLGQGLFGAAERAVPLYYRIGQALSALTAPLAAVIQSLGGADSLLPKILFTTAALLALGAGVRLLWSPRRMIKIAGIPVLLAGLWLSAAAGLLLTKAMAAGEIGFVPALFTLLAWPAAALLYGSLRLLGPVTYGLPFFLLFLSLGFFQPSGSGRKRVLLFSFSSLASALFLFLFLSFALAPTGTPMPESGLAALLIDGIPRRAGIAVFGVLSLLSLSLLLFSLISRRGSSKERRPGKNQPKEEPVKGSLPETEWALTPLEEETAWPPFAEDETAVSAPPPAENHQEIESARKRIGLVLEELELPLTFSHAVAGPSLLLTAYDLPEKTPLAGIEKREKELTFRLTEEEITPLIPVPGEEKVGFLVPRTAPSPLTLGPKGRKLFAAQGLPVYAGQDIRGRDFIIDLTALPHLLVAGATGSGKSVFLHSLIHSLCRGPERNKIRLVLADPKRVEFSGYAALPNLAVPVAEEPAEILSLLDNLLGIMEARYRILKQKKKRSITELSPEDAGMPFLVAVIDEVADLFLSEEGKPLKKSLIRLAQKSRAVGIHLIIATQRPSADIIDGLIKANFPARLAFRTASATDSRIILGRNGAEKLRGRGDALYVSPDQSEPVRFQSAFCESLLPDLNKE